MHIEKGVYHLAFGTVNTASYLAGPRDRPVEPPSSVLGEVVNASLCPSGDQV